jgi:putative transposase
MDNSHNEKMIKHYQKELSKKVKYSRRRENIRIKLAKQHAKLANRRKWLLHQITTYLVNENQVICMEDLNVSGMVKNHCLAKSVENSSFGEIKRILQYKCEWYGRKLIQVGRFYPSSKTCNVCGYVNKELRLSDRKWTCPECGTKHDRDINAAMNILSEGERIIGLSSSEFTHKEKPTVDDRSEMNLKSSVSMRCEKKVFQ